MVTSWFVRPSSAIAKAGHLRLLLRQVGAAPLATTPSRPTPLRRRYAATTGVRRTCGRGADAPPSTPPTSVPRAAEDPCSRTGTAQPGPRARDIPKEDRQRLITALRCPYRAIEDPLKAPPSSVNLHSYHNILGDWEHRPVSDSGGPGPPLHLAESISGSGAAPQHRPDRGREPRRQYSAPAIRSPQRMRAVAPSQASGSGGSRRGRGWAAMNRIFAVSSPEASSAAAIPFSVPRARPSPF